MDNFHAARACVLIILACLEDCFDTKKTTPKPFMGFQCLYIKSFQILQMQQRREIIHMRESLGAQNKIGGFRKLQKQLFS